MRIDPTQLTYSHHARQRMTQRNLTRHDIERVVARPTCIRDAGDSDTPGRTRHGYIRDNTVVVLDGDVVITAYIRDRQHR